MGNQKYTKIKELFKEHDENKKKILSQLAKQKSSVNGEVLSIIKLSIYSVL